MAAAVAGGEPAAGGDGWAASGTATGRGAAASIVAGRVATGRSAPPPAKAAGPSAPPPVDPTGRPEARFVGRAMGSPLRLMVSGAATVDAEAAWSAASGEIEAIEQSLSRFRVTSALTALNSRAGDRVLRPVDGWLYAALAAADRAGRTTDGRFDARILGDLERLGYRGAGLPDRVPDARGREAAGAGRGAAPAPGTVERWLRRDPRARSVAIETPVDLGGIGKGLALRWALRRIAAVLPGFGVTAGVLLEAGGDIVGVGPSPGGGPWLIGIEDPRGGAEPLAAAVLDGGAMCTSSVGVHAWQAPDGRPVHHLIDPRTGQPGGAGLLAVTVAGTDPAWAETWSKALFMEGAGGIGALARARGIDAWWVGLDGALSMTPGARARTAWTL